MDTDGARLSALLAAECDKRKLTYKDASRLLEQADNAMSRWINLQVAPSPDQWPAIAAFLGISEIEVATALARDRIALREARRSL